MLVKDIMTRKVDVVDPNASLVIAARKMRDADVGSLPVGEGDRLVGMITDRDMVVRSLAEGKDGNFIPVRDAMSTEVFCCFDDQPMEEAADLMSKHQVQRLPVINRKNRLVGILSRSDLSERHPKRKPYRVTFYKQRIDSSGKLHNVQHTTVFISGCDTKEEAVAAAIRKFEEDKGVSPWNKLADGCEATEAG